MIHLFFDLAQSVNINVLPHDVPANSSTIGNILAIVWAIIGATSLLVITFGGFRYITAQGEPQKMAQARNTILYAAIGIVVAASAEAIVTFVFGNL